MPSSVARARRKRSEPAVTRWIASHQLELSLIPLGLIAAGNLVTRPSFSLAPLHPLHHPSLEPTWHVSGVGKFVYLSYRDPKTGLCLKGPDDFYLVVCWIFVWLAARVFSMRSVFVPLARRLRITDPKEAMRFAEQGWSAIYYLTFWPLGMYIWQSSEYSAVFSSRIWAGYPHFALPPLTKFYYLVQTAFWFTQLVVVNIEKRRKDHVQMSVHHVITIALIVGSYACNLTRAGNVVLCLMDLSDIFLAVAKMLKYADIRIGDVPLCDPCFGAFMLSWVVTRHALFLGFIRSALVDGARQIPYRWDPTGGFFFNRPSHLSFVALLAALEVLMCIWFTSICRVAWRTIRGHGAEDIRSDESSEDEPAEELTEPIAKPNGIANGHARPPAAELKKRVGR